MIITTAGLMADKRMGCGQMLNEKIMYCTMHLPTYLFALIISKLHVHDTSIYKSADQRSLAHKRR